jgi:hypothetical protein
MSTYNNATSKPVSVSTVVKAKDFDPKLLYIEPVPQRNKSGGKYVRVCYGPRKVTLKLQSPEVYLPFGVSSFEDDKGVTTQSIEVSLRGHDEADKPGMGAFYAALQAIDEAILTAAEVNSKAWFGKELSRPLLQEFQKPLVKPPKDPKYAPLFKAKAVKDFKTQEMPKVFELGNTKDVLPIEYIVRGTTGKILVTMPSIYLIGKTFGVAARLLQMVVTSRPVQDEGCLILPDDDDETATVGANNNKQGSDDIILSDDDEECF